MKKVGLVTIYYNYGSILQAYALKCFFENNNCICDFVAEDMISLRYLIKHCFKIARIMIFSKKKNLELNKNTPYVFNRNFITFKKNFIQLNLHPKTYEKPFLKCIDDIYDHFFVGSDQVWSTRIGKINSFYLLDFASKNKKNSLSPSFGNREIHSKSFRILKRELPKFANLSVRETAGKEIIKELCGLNAIVLSDPVTLHTADFWKEFCKNGFKIKEKYIFVHFLSNIKKEYLRLIYELAKKEQMKIISFYNDANIKTFNKDVVNVEGKPEDLVSLISGAEYVFTDSFHTGQFAVIFNKNFYIIPRVYKKGLSEQPRIDELVTKFSCKERIIDDTFTLEKLLNIKNQNFDKQLNYWSNLTKSYILNIINKSKTVNNVSINKNVCVNCKLCQINCPSNAISFTNDKFLYPYPIVDTKKCINCGLCLNICNSKINNNISGQHKGYIAYNKDEKYRSISSSGGVFSSLAYDFIIKGGIVFGAKMILDGKNSRVELAKAENIGELMPLLKSKYVECECYDCFPIIKKFLDEGKNVLVANTSCKIAALYKYLKKDYQNLFTIDLICHGVPGNPLFGKYIDYLEKKHKGKVINFSFRRGTGGFPGSYYEDVDIKKKNGKIVHYSLPYKKSMYYYLFLKAESYRESCYNCKYATIDKPANITIGDYFEAIKDYPNLVNKEMINKGINCLIVHNKRGKELISKCGNNLFLLPVDYKKIQLSHLQLCFSLTYTKKRYTSFKITSKYNGFKIFKKHFCKFKLSYAIHYLLSKPYHKINR